MKKNRSFEAKSGDGSAPDGASDPSVVRTAVGIVWFLAVINILLSVLALVFQFEFLLNLGAGEVTGLLGVFYAVMAILLREKRSVWALGFATALLAFDTVSIVVFHVLDGVPGNSPAGATVTRVFLLYYLVKAIPALRRMRSQHSGLASSPVLS